MNIRPACGGTSAMLMRIFFLVFGLLALTGSAHAALTINSVTLNGGTSVTVAPGATISVTVSETNTGGSNWRSTRFTTSPATSTTCVNTPNHDGNGTYSETFTITAPATPGTYDAIFRASSDGSCGGTTSSLFTLTGGIVVVQPPPLVVSINRSTFDPTMRNTSVTWTVTFDYAVTGVDASDFQLVQSGGVTGASITSVTGSGTTWTVTANTGTGPTGTLRLDLIDNDTIMTGGVPLGGAGAGNGNFSGQSYTLVQSICATAANIIFCDDFERANPGTVGNGWTVTPASAWNCTGTTGNTGCAGIDRDIPPFNDYTVPHATNTRSMFTRWNIVSVDSPVVNLAGRPAALLSFWIRRGHDSFSECPEATTENYLVQYYASDGTWKILAQYPSSPSAAACDGRIFTPTIQLPPDALHANFRMRFYQPGGSGDSGYGGAPGVVGYDYWHMDDVLIVEAPASSYVGAFCDNFEGGLGRWSITAEGAPVSANIGDAGLGTTDYQSASHELDTRWGYVVASTLRTDMTGVTGDITYWVKSGTTAARDPDSGEDLVVEYFNSGGTWTSLATYPGTAAAGTVYNGSHVLPADAKHAGFRLRFRQLNGSRYDNDYWHIDDVCVGTILPTADLALAKTRGAALVPGANIPYTLTVTNNGPGTLNGSLEIVDTLPASLGYLSFSGSGWACSVNVQIVTCNWNGTLASGATAPPLTLTAQLSLSASGIVTNTATVTGTVVDNTPANNTATESGTVIAATLIAQYHLEELLWNGTAGEMKDTAGYAGGPFNGMAIGSAFPAPALSSPARTGNPGTCGYATLPGPVADGGAFTISGLPVSISAGAKTSVAFWMYWDGTDSVMPVGWTSHSLLLQGGSFGFHSGNGDIFGIASAGLSGGWHHVVAVFTNGSVAANQLYIDGAAQTLTQRQGAPNPANAVVSSDLRIGGWGQNSSYRFSGRIDEMLVYKDALVQADVTAIYNATHPCAAAVDHYELSLPTTGIACLASTATVTACANSSSPCTSPSAAVNGQTATLATNGGTLGSTTVTFNASGVASTTLSYPSLTTDGTAVTVTLSGETVPALNLRKCCPDGASCVVANSCNITFNTAGFIFANTADSTTPWTVPTQVAGTSSGTHYLRSVQTNTFTRKCESGLTGSNVPVDFAYRCVDPTTCYSSNLMSVNGGTATTITRNDNSVADAALSYQQVNLNFDANGNAPLTFVYSDVGQVKLYAKKTLTADFTKTPPVTAHTLRGNTNAFVVKPDHFVLSDIQQTAAPNLANPGAGDATGAKFVKAGEAFSVKVTAVTSAGSPTPNYGREATAEGVKLTSALVTGLGLTNNPALVNSTIPGSEFGPGGMVSDAYGVATVTNLNWPEVGIITLTPSVADGDYLGAGDVSGTASGNVGRFYAAQFVLTNGVLGNRADLVKTGSIAILTPSTLTLAAAAGVQVGDDLRIVGAGAGGATLSTTAVAVSADGLTVTLAAPASAAVANTPVYMGKFTYIGEPMAALFTLTATALDGTTLQNYNWSATPANRFANLDLLAGSNPLGLGAVDSAATRTPFPPCSVTPAHPCLIPEQATAGTFASGVANITVPFKLYRGTTAVGPYALLDVGVAPQDNDGTILSAYDLDTVNVVAGTNNHGKVGRTEARFGRLTLSNAYGSELLKLPVPMEVQYRIGSYWATNTDDHATSIVPGNIALSNGSVTIDCVTSSDCAAPKGTTTNGKWNVVLNKPSAAANTFVCVDLDNAVPRDASCQATTPLFMPYLQTGMVYDKDPASRATFGIYKNRFIYLREMY